MLGLIASREEFDPTLAWDEEMDAKIDALGVDQVNAASRRHVALYQLSIAKEGNFKTAGAYGKQGSGKLFDLAIPTNSRFRAPQRNVGSVAFIRRRASILKSLRQSTRRSSAS